MTANRNQAFDPILRRVLAALLTVCVALSAWSFPRAARAASGSFVQAGAAGATVTSPEGTTITLAAGTLLLLQYPDVVPINGVDHYYVYYNSRRYQTPASQTNAVSDADAESYIRNSIWTSTGFSTLKQENNLIGDVQVYALQLALKSLGYYSDSLDGNYGSGTEKAVYRFQRDNGLVKDGDAGPLTQQALYALARGSSAATIATATPAPGTTGSSSVGGSTSGTLRTTASVNLRAKASQSSSKLGSVPLNSVLVYYNTSVSGGVTWYQVLYNNLSGWLMGTYVNVLSSGGGSSAGTLVTNAKVNLRKSASKSSARLGVVPQGVSLAYSDSKTSGGTTWYKVAYGVNTGWLMGTYVSASGSSSGGSGSSSSGSGTLTVTGKVEITKANTRVRKTPGGSKTGVVLSKGTTVDMVGTSSTSGGYTWYPVMTSSGVTGFVRGDCAVVVNSGTGSGSSSDSGSAVTPTITSKYITVPATITVYAATSKDAAVGSVPQGAVVQMAGGSTVTGTDGAVYCSIYYQSRLYYALYSDVSVGVMTDAQLATYVTQLWSSALNDKFYNDGTLVADVRVYAMQLALYVLGYYTGSLDGTYGSSSEAAVKNFQRAQKLDRDGVMGNLTWAELGKLAKQVSNGSSSSSVTPVVSPTTTAGTSATVTDFGVVNSVSKPTWTEADNGNYWPKYSFATVLDVTTGKVFTIYRTGGTNHPDAVPYTIQDTKTMCEIVGFTYPERRPTSDELSKIVSDNGTGNSNYTWPDFSGKLTGVKKIGSAWDRRPALLNVNGKVYAVSIYGWPHGFMGIGAKDGLSTQKFPNGNLLYENNNFYGCICIRFYDSKGHGSANQTVINQHNAAADQAYNYARQKWPALCK